MASKGAQTGGSVACASCGYEAGTVSIAFCPGCGKSFVPAKPKRARRQIMPRIGWLSVPKMRYPRAYSWFIYFSALDIVLTWVILLLGGVEVNPVADAVIATGGRSAIITYKFCLALLVVVICEVVGRRRPRTGRNLALSAIAMTAMPVFLSIWQLFTS